MLKKIWGKIGNMLFYTWITVAFSFIFLCLVGIIGVGRIAGDSSYPTIKPGSFGFGVTTSAIEIQRGDFVDVFDWIEWNNTVCAVKRVIGLPGETIEIIDSVVYIDGQPLDEPYKNTTSQGIVGTTWDPVTLGEDEYFVMGDNRNNSKDSRTYGPVTSEQIKFVVLFNVDFSEGFKVAYNRFSNETPEFLDVEQLPTN